MISPDGSRLAAGTTRAPGRTDTYIVTMSLTGTDIQEVPDTRTRRARRASFYAFDWRPDGNGYLIGREGNGWHPARSACTTRRRP